MSNNKDGCLDAIKESYKSKISKFINDDEKILDDTSIYDLEKIINKKKTSKQVMTKLLKSIGFENIKLTLYKDNNNLYRMNHILFTFALGTLLCDFNDLKSKIEKRYSKYFPEGNAFIKVWMLTSLYHDYGYHINKEYESKGEIKSLNDVPVIYNIFEYANEDDLNVVSRYSQDLFENYFLYNFKYNTNEKFEHGTLGGYVLYNQIVAKCDTNMKNLYRDISYRIMDITYGS